jgi:replicative DNA helicase
MSANYIAGTDALAGWRDDVLSGKPPVLYPLGSGELAGIEAGPGRVLLLGGAPGAGKTSFILQLVFDALRLTPGLRALICNVETSPNALLDRQLARVSGIDLRTISRRQFGAAHAGRLAAALATLEPLLERLAFVCSPFTLENVANTLDDFQADMLVLDYIQRIPAPGNHADGRVSINSTMDHLRRFADAGLAVFVISAVGRTRDSKGRSSYSGEGLNLASFRESSELEFGCDDAYLVVPDAEDAETVYLRHLKARHSEPKDIVLTFDRCRQRFAPFATQSGTDDANVREKLRRAWKQTAAAEEGGEE